MMAWLIPPSSPSLPSLHYSTPFPTCSSTGGCLRWYGRLLFFSCGLGRKGRIWRSVWCVIANLPSWSVCSSIACTVQYHPCTVPYIINVVSDDVNNVEVFCFPYYSRRVRARSARGQGPCHAIFLVGRMIGVES